MVIIIIKNVIMHYYFLLRIRSTIYVPLFNYSFLDWDLFSFCMFMNANKKRRNAVV